MHYHRNRFCLTALLVLFSVGSIDAASFTSGDLAQFDRVPDSRKKEKLETKGPPEDALTYYVTIRGGGYVTVADDFGHSNTPLLSSASRSEIANFAVPNVSIDVLGKDTVQLVMPLGQNYTLYFRGSGEPLNITLIEGVSNMTPNRAVRYVDLMLPRDAQAMFRFTSKGVEPLRYDQDGDGVYESIVVATVVASGSEARDITPPVVKFSEQLKGAKRKVTIKATDGGSGVKVIYYSFDRKTYQLYLGPLLFDSAGPHIVYAFADDRVGNRSSIATTLESELQRE